MLENTTNTKPATSKSKQKGQVAIFVALIFQVLFVFFAMLVNIGLLVHHKINLQNSVDLAAYYGAMKQAEILNTIAHVNYQIRQSWKLMTFRYRHLGSYGDLAYPGRPGGVTTVDSNDASSLFPAFCVIYNPFTFATTDNFCKKSAQQSTYVVQAPPIPNFLPEGIAQILGVFGFQSTTVAAIDNIQNQILKTCTDKITINLFALLRFITTYKFDVANRKRLIIQLANRMSKNTNTFQDLDGDDVERGAQQTLLKNLTYQNKAGLGSFSMYNSMGNPACGATGDKWTPPKWLSEIFIYPVFYAFMADCQKPQITFYPSAINAGGLVPGNILNSGNLGQEISKMLDISGEPDGTVPLTNLYKSSLGFEKNPWCMSYVSVSATATPKIPFSPWPITLHATAYAKPFGGSIGPWNRSKWSSGSPISNGGNEVDSVAPPRIIPPQGFDDATNPRLSPDISRYVGDEIGTKSNMNMMSYSKAFQDLNYMSLDWWNQLSDPTTSIEQTGTTGDILAWSDNDPEALKMRTLEISAIIPDQFDLAYYSVEPDYYRNYFNRLLKQESTFGFPIRGDIGLRKGAQDEWKSFSVKDQIKLAMDKSMLDYQGTLTYFAHTFAELLTSFKAKAPDDQVMDEANNFGKCNTPIPDNAPDLKATSGNCIGGGRVGYSVKLIDGTFLQTEQPLGGPGSSGLIQNPPPMQ